MLEVHNLEVSYGDVQVLWGVDFEVRQNEIVALVGSNGAGKTTLFKTISGLLKPSKGSIHFAGSSLAGIPSAEVVRHGIVYVPEGRRLFAGMTVEENLIMGAYLRNDKQAVKRDLDRVYEYFPRLAERRRQLAGKMSGGEQQMCAIARGLMAQPKLMMIDELSLGLAPIIVEQLIEILRQIHQEGVMLAIVEQDVQTALQIADRAYVMEQGRIAKEDRASVLLEDDSIKTAYLGI